MSAPIKILIVDDEEAILRNFKALLEDRGHSVISALNGKEALSLFAKHRPDIVFTDLRMPEMNGLTLISNLKQLAPEIPTVVVSGTGNIKDAIEAIHHGAWDYLLKPLQETGEVEIVLQRTLEHARLRVENKKYVKDLEGAIIQKSKDIWYSEIKFRTLIESSPLPIILIKDNRINYVNNAAIRIYAFKNSKEMVGKLSEELFASGAERDLQKQLAENDFALLVNGIKFETKAMRKDFSTFPANITVGSITLAEGPAIIIFTEDISERRKLEEQLRQAQKLETIGQLAGGVAHDFNNILTAIIGFSDLLRRKISSDVPSTQILTQVQQASDRAKKLTRSLLSFCHQQEVIAKYVDLNTIITQSQSFLKRLLSDDISLTTSCHDSPVPIYADSCQIEQILMNLASNARDAMPGGGEIIIRTDIQKGDASHPNGFAILIVSDTGEGMDPETKSKIFEAFFTTKAVGVGTGLGLAIVDGIVRQHGGFINVESDKEKGTTFKIFLPLMDKEKIIGISATGAEEYPKGGNEAILVADDDASLLGLAEIFLRDFGYRVITAVDGQDAVDKFKLHADEVDLLFFDTIMPRKNGVAAYEEIRAIRPEIKALFTTGYSSEVAYNRGKMEANLELMMKPVRPIEFLYKIREMLDREQK